MEGFDSNSATRKRVVTHPNMPRKRLVKKGAHGNDATYAAADSDNGIESDGFIVSVSIEADDSTAMRAAVVAWLMIASFGAVAVHYSRVQPYMDEVLERMYHLETDQPVSRWSLEQLVLRSS